MQLSEKLKEYFSENEILLTEYCAEDTTFSCSLTSKFTIDLLATATELKLAGFHVLLLARLKALVITSPKLSIHVKQSKYILMNGVKSEQHVLNTLKSLVPYLRCISLAANNS